MCPHCGSDGDCPHLLAYVDATFGEAVSGFCADKLDQVCTLICSHFRAASQNAAPDWADNNIQALWSEWDANGDSGDDEDYLDPTFVIDLLLDVFESDLATYGDSSVVEGGPGMTSTFLTFYADDPALTFEQALLAITARLVSAQAS
jgi:hypothetical protein